MLVNLHVKNFAIIDEIDVDFGKNLNIMTGETGAGKSILVGSISIALGARVSPEMIGKNGDYAMVEVVFQIENDTTLKKIRELDIEPEDGQVVISRKITGNRSINKINGESVSVGIIRRVAALCIDIHGQHEHQSLLNRERHLEIVDEFGGKTAQGKRKKVSEIYKKYRELKNEMEADSVSDEERARQLGFLQYEKDEIEDASLKSGEIEEVEKAYQKSLHAGTVVEALSSVYRGTSDTAMPAISQGIRRLSDVTKFDNSVSAFSEQLMQIESLLGDFNRDISEFMSDFTFDEAELNQLENRFNCIRNLQAKYGDRYEDIEEHYKNVCAKLEQYEDYENYRKNQQIKFEKLTKELEAECEKLSECRKKTASRLEKKISQALSDLNFAHVDFSIEVRKKNEFGADGQDEVEFMIATNPGEPRRSLSKVVSGGELSRIMLAIKSVFADSDEIETLIFDEIDVGISGRTAQKVSEKMCILGKNHQVLCITHLAQIAAMADTHFVIEKVVEKEKSTTRIRPLSPDETREELARILGGVEITDAVRISAQEMKEMAEKQKNNLKNK